MKRTPIKNLAVMMAAVVILGSVPPAQPTMAAELTVSAVEAAGSYQHDPMKNPKAAADIVENPDAVYGYSPSPESKRLKEYVDYDWTDETVVNQMREQRETYHASMQELYDMIDSMKAEGKGIEEIARAVSTRRNEIRLEAYKDDPEGLEKVKQSNLDTYGNENGGTPDYFYEKYGSWETVLEKALSVNAGADACLGLYDKYYDTYLIEEDDPEKEDPDTTEKAFLTVAGDEFVNIDVDDPDKSEGEGWIADNIYQADINSELFISPSIDFDHAVKTVTVDNGKDQRTIEGFYTNSDCESLKNAIGSIVMSEDKKVTMLTVPYASVWGLYSVIEDGKKYDTDDLSAVDPGTYTLMGTYGNEYLLPENLNAEKTVITGGTASTINGLTVVIGEEDRGKTLELSYVGADGVLGRDGSAFSGSLSITVTKELEGLNVYDDAKNTKINKLTVGYGETEKIRIEPNDGAILADGYPEIAFYKDADGKIPYEDVDNRIRCVVQHKKVTDYRQIPVYFITGKKPSETAEENSFYMHIKSGSAETMLPVTVKDTTLQTPLLSVTGVTDKNLSMKLSMPAGVTYESLTSGRDYWWDSQIETLYYHVVARNTVSENQEPYYDRYLHLDENSDSTKSLPYEVTIPLDAVPGDAREVTVTATFCREVNYLFDEEKYEDIEGFTQTSESVISKNVLKDHAQPTSMKLQNVKRYLYDYQEEDYEEEGVYTTIARVVYNGGSILATDENTSCTSNNPNVSLSVSNGEIRAKYTGTMTSSSEKATVTVTPKGLAASKSISLTVAHAISDISFANRQHKDSGEGDITLYKQEGKALNYILSPQFLSEGADPYDKDPKISYYDYYSDDSLKSYISFNQKTGKIAVKADYKPRSGDRISVIAKVLDRNGEVQCGGTVNVCFTTNAPEEAGQLALITSTDKGATYSIITDAKTPLTKSVLLNSKYTKFVMLSKNAPASGSVKAETLFGSYILVDPHYELAAPAGVFLKSGYLEGASHQTDAISEFTSFQFGKTMTITATERTTQETYDLILKTEEDVLPADAVVDHLEYIGSYGDPVLSGDDNTLTFYDENNASHIAVVFRDGNGKLYKSYENPYSFSFKNTKDLKATDSHQYGYCSVSMKKEVLDKKQKGTLKVSFKTAKTTGSGLQTKTSQEFTIINDPEGLPDPGFKDDGEKLNAKTSGQSKTLTASVSSNYVKASLPASYKDSKGKVRSAYKDAETLAGQINQLWMHGTTQWNGVTYDKEACTLTFDKSITITGTKSFTIYLSMGTIDETRGSFVPETRKCVWTITPQAIGKFTPAKQYKMKIVDPKIDLAKPGEAAVGGKNYDTNTVIDAGVYNVVTKGKENSFSSLFRVVDGTTLTITDQLDVILKFLADYSRNPKEAEKEWLTGYIQLTTNTYNPKNTYLTKVTVGFEGTLTSLTP